MNKLETHELTWIALQSLARHYLYRSLKMQTMLCPWAGYVLLALSPTPAFLCTLQYCKRLETCEQHVTGSLVTWFLVRFCQCLALTKRLENRRNGEAIFLSVPGSATSNGGSSRRRWLEMSISIVSIVAMLAVAVPTCNNQTEKKGSEQILWSHSPLLLNLLPALHDGPNQPEVRSQENPVEQSVPLSFLSTKKGGELICRGKWMKLNIAPLSHLFHQPFICLCNQFSVLSLPLCEIHKMVSIFLTRQWLI